ncbi:hypothetical protein N7493_004908 [Penicillium malachiteum]|uniref:Uncharacterized protein n=1 Tax=Penicillium malachiteum TaxID=1324776 RepID=A0AAD6HLX5_9EURO|nr:hypothetical protein N7493_004908 [Penicillium malachiteum]
MAESDDTRTGTLGSEEQVGWDTWRQWPEELEQDTSMILPNLGGTIRYQNAIYQMLLHYPVFLQWLNYYYREHSGPGTQCQFGTNGMECKLCQFLHFARNYWRRDEEECLSRHQAIVNIFLADWDGGSHAGSEQNFLDFYIEIQRQFTEQIPGDDQRSAYRRAHQFRDEFLHMFTFDIFRVTECQGSSPCAPVRGEEVPFNWALQISNDTENAVVSHPVAELVSPDEDGVCAQCGDNPRTIRNAIEDPPEIIIARAPRRLFERQDLGAVLTPLELSNYLELKAKVFDDEYATTEDVRYELFTVLVQAAPRRPRVPAATGDNEPEDDYKNIVKAKTQWADVSEESEQGPALMEHIDNWEWNYGQASIGYRRRGFFLAFRRLSSDAIPSKRAVEYQAGSPEDLAVGFDAISVPNPGVLTLTFEQGEDAGTGPESSTISPDAEVDRARMRGVPFADLTMTIPMNSLHFPETNPTGRLLIEFQDSQNQVVDTFEIKGILRDLLNKRPQEHVEEKKPTGVRKRKRSRLRNAFKGVLRRAKGKKNEAQAGEAS